MSEKGDVVAIKPAVEHLQELSERMQTEDYGFRDNDVDNIDSIIDALQELDGERLKLHDRLETETIRASVLRHQLMFLPATIDKEIKAAVKSARDSNADAMASLKKELATINGDILYLERKQQEIEEENAKLMPERDAVREKHEQIIAQLNVRMAQKANQQIELNETRDKLRATNQGIVNLEESILILKEDMIAERSDARMEKKRLKKAVYDTTMKTRNQREANIVKKKELDELQEKLAESESKLDIIRKSIRRYDTSRSKMEGQERALTAQLNKEIKANQDLKQKGIDIRKEDERLQAEFKVKKQHLDERMKMLDEQIEKESKRNERLEGRKMILEMDVEERLEIRRADAAKLDEVNGMLQTVKTALAKKAEDVGRLQQENINTEEAIVQLKETHEFVVAALNQQIEEYREQLNKERQERMELQAQRDNVQKTVDDFRQNNSKFLQQMNKKLQEQKMRIEELKQESVDLHKAIIDGDTKLKDLRVELATAKDDYQNMKNVLDAQLKELETGVANTKESITTKTEWIGTQTPIFEQLEVDFDQKGVDYEQKKKDIVALKSKKTGLEDNIRRTKKEIDRVEGPMGEQEKAKEELKLRREESLAQLRKQAEEVKSLERDIYTVGCKLRTVLEENHRFREYIKRYEEETVEFQSQKVSNEELKEKLMEELLNMKGVLVKGWEADHALEEANAERDTITVGEIDQLLKKTESRESKISNITDHLETELSSLAAFLENVASRRPKDSRQGKRSRSRLESRQSTRSSTGTKGILKSSSAHSPDKRSSSRQSPDKMSPTRSPTKSGSDSKDAGDSQKPKSAMSAKKVTMAEEGTVEESKTDNNEQTE